MKKKKKKKSSRKPLKNIRKCGCHCVHFGCQLCAPENLKKKKLKKFITVEKHKRLKENIVKKLHNLEIKQQTIPQIIMA